MKKYIIKRLLQLIPILFDLGAGALLYKIAKRKFSEGSSLILSATYVLSPVVVLDSSAWGQVDGVFTFFLLLVCYLCMEEKRIFAYFAFVAGVLIKPQMIMFAPLLIWTIIEQVFLKDFSKENVKVLNGDENGSHTFTKNGEFTFMIQDEAGNIGYVTAKVTYSMENAKHLSDFSELLQIKNRLYACIISLIVVCRSFDSAFIDLTPT